MSRYAQHAKILIMGGLILGTVAYFVTDHDSPTTKKKQVNCTVATTGEEESIDVKIVGSYMYSSTNHKYAYLDLVDDTYAYRLVLDNDILIHSGEECILHLEYINSEGQTVIKEAVVIYDDKLYKANVCKSIFEVPLADYLERY